MKLTKNKNSMSLSPTTIKPAKGSNKKSKRLGRGNSSGAGNYSGRGMNGQRARSGGKGGLKIRGFKPVLQSTPKLRGFKSGNVKPAEVRLSDLDKKYNDGEVVSLKTLVEKGLISKNAKNAKIILKGELKKKLIVEGIKYTKTAGEAIKKVGGEIKEVSKE